MTWDTLLSALAEAPRENGTAALDETARYLAQALEAAGARVELVRFVAHPFALRLAGVLALAGGLFYFRFLRAGRPLRALAIAALLPVLLVAELDGLLPVFGWIGAATQQHVVARVSPAGSAAPAQRLLFTAHYDTKTDLLDHVERAPIDLLGAPILLFMVAGAICLRLAQRGARRSTMLQRVATAAAWTGALYGVALFLVLSAGAFVTARSPGALDDGAACAVLVQVAEALAAQPLARTEVEIVLLSAEEVGVQGSREYANARFAEPPDLPTAVVNLEGIGAAADLALFRREAFVLRSYPPDPQLAALLDAVHREQRGRPLHVTFYPATTDARSFLVRGVPAATLLSDPADHALLRHLHSARDDRSRLDPDALSATRDYLLAVARAADARGL